MSMSKTNADEYLRLWGRMSLDEEMSYRNLLEAVRRASCYASVRCACGTCAVCQVRKAADAAADATARARKAQREAAQVRKRPMADLSKMMSESVGGRTHALPLDTIREQLEQLAKGQERLAGMLIATAIGGPRGDLALALSKLWTGEDDLSITPDEKGGG